MRLSKVERDSHSRFGCFLRVREKTFYLDWSWPQLKAAKEAPVLVRMIPGPSDNGCLLCMAFEVSPIRFLPRYSFYPLDLRKEPHKGILESAFQSGTLNLCFVHRSGTLRRQIALPKSLVPRLTELYRTCLDRIEVSPRRELDFSQAVKEFAASERATQHFPWAFTELELELFSTSLRQQAAQASDAVAQEQRLFVNVLFDTLGQNYGQTIAKWMEGLPTVLVALHFTYDLYSAFRDEPKQLVEVLSHWLATDPLEVKNLSWVPEAVNSICGLLVRLGKSSAEQKKELAVALVLSVADFGRRLSAERRISWKTLQESLVPIKPLLSAGPGRPRVDYSLAHKLKQERSWTKVAEAFYNLTPQLQAEFGQPTFAQLSYQQKDQVSARVRSGVRRTEKTQSQDLSET